MRKRTLTMVMLLAAAATVTAGLIGGVARTQAGPSPETRWTLDAREMSALTHATTKLAGVPSRASGFGEFEPAQGTVHRLGSGAVAWQARGRICWIANAAGGCVQGVKLPMDWTFKDPDFVGSGEPAAVFGLAIDSVRKVTVGLRNGTMISAVPAANFYVVTLPADALPDDFQSITATMANGSTAGFPAVSSTG
jgi:hypothetical protein